MMVLSETRAALVTGLLWLLPACQQWGATKAHSSFQKGRVPLNARSSSALSPQGGPCVCTAVSLLSALAGVYFPSEDPSFGAFSRRGQLTSGKHTVPSEYLLIAHDSFLVHHLSSEDACCNPCSRCSPDQARLDLLPSRNYHLDTLRLDK